jgi:hypothetical protein
MAPETTTPATTPPATPENPYDAMASVFDELTTPEPPANPDEETSSTTEVDEAAAAAKAAGETPPAEGAPAEGEASATPPAETTPPAEETPPADDWKAKYEALQAERAQPPKAETPPPAETPPAAQPAPDLYTPEETAAIADYEKEWSEVSRGEALKRRGEYAQIVNHIFSEITRTFGPLIERGAAAADTVAETAALTIIQRAHTDYDDAMYEAVVDWADKLPGTRKRIAQAIIEEGDPSEVVDLLTEFKTSTGRNKPRVVAGDAATPPAAPVVTELSAKAKQAAKAMSVVDSKRTTPAPVAADPDDFDAAWDEAVGGK